ncbi:hypothetical protein HG535_0B01110 [Zygotorulaspora mrakii]|uniref:Lon protease homolog 2, peroxisomal n=1 Tax=Zygotorulaspora mrakii TaxID=42260 RepID=A0A7H9AXT6_ZYGMR|nr:uncharacterized protein HG535_0B01110 [Zygotorulaspora mrakii]QLG71073.1 hypothetical protein HG535_0B01110 [Zygotorulaspora mrakii]
MLFSRCGDECVLRSFPCLSLEQSPSVVPLPGILYKITFGRSDAENILGYFKSSKHYQKHFLLADVKAWNKQNFDTANKETIESLETFGRTFDPPNDDKGLYICLIPAKSKDNHIGCISKVVGVLTEEKVVTISFKTFCRAIVKTPSSKPKCQVWSSELSLDSVQRMVKSCGNEQMKRLIAEFIEVLGTTDNFINSFKKKYEILLDKTSGDHLLLLSPLSNTLYFQLNKAQFNKAWSTLLGLITELTESMDEAPINANLMQILKLMDLTVTVLPTSTTQKLDFLSSFSLIERCEIFKTIMDDFKQVFKHLYSSTEYVQAHFSQASNLEKSRLIANQLKSLRFFIEDVKAQNRSRIPMAASKVKSMISIDGKERKSPPAQGDESDPEDDLSGDENDEMTTLRDFIKNLNKLGVHRDGIKLLRKDFKIFLSTNPQNAEYQVLRNYFDVVNDIPFGKYTNRASINLEEARQKLDNDHFGLNSVKNRLIEYLCTLKLSEQLKKRGESRKSPILLLVGPPGVGKTSIAKSVADMLNLKFQRISLGGVHNEAEIRGHRRTYVGAMCGIIINALKKSGCMNPLILLDEVDKLLSTTGSGSGYGFKLNGDPGAALLEVLDPEQNNTFMDHYVGFPVDLSQVLFLCTANDLAGISGPLLDRLEVIEIPGYTPEEKVKIGSKFLLPKQIRINGLDKCERCFTLSNQAWYSLVTEYVRESGVRNLERKLATIVRGKVVEYVKEEDHQRTNDQQIVTKNEMFKYLGFPLHPIATELLRNVKMAEKEGIVNGLSYSSDGTGNVLVFEIIKTGSVDKSQGPVTTATGNLGTVLQESIDIGCSLVKSILRRGLIVGEDCQITNEFFSSKYHLHVPMGAISKDGPSAGTAITLALMSLALRRPVDPLLCMTGEITLRGKILPIGGVKEKLLGAQMYGMKRVLLPIANKQDVIQAVADSVAPFIEDKTSQDEISLVQEKMNLSVAYVSDIYDVLRYAWPDITFHAEVPVEQNHQCLSKM